MPRLTTAVEEGTVSCVEGMITINDMHNLPLDIGILGTQHCKVGKNTMCA